MTELMTPLKLTIDIDSVGVSVPDGRWLLHKDIHEPVSEEGISQLTEMVRRANEHEHLKAEIEQLSETIHSRDAKIKRLQRAVEAAKSIILEGRGVVATDKPFGEPA